MEEILPPVEIYKTHIKRGYLPYQLVQDFLNQQYLYIVYIGDASPPCNTGQKDYHHVGSWGEHPKKARHNMHIAGTCEYPLFSDFNP